MSRHAKEIAQSSTLLGTHTRRPAATPGKPGGYPPRGGNLLLTALRAPNGRVHALAQGPLSVGGHRYDANGNPFKAYQTHYQWKNGLVVKDWRYVVRICNIDTATFAAMSGTQATTAVATNILHMMLRAVDRIPNLAMGRAAFYMNRSVYSLLRRLAMEKSVNSLALESGADQFGNATRWTSFEGIPLRKVDQLLNTEARVV